MMKFPSYPLAILAGAICTPILILGIDYMEKSSCNQFLQFVWFIIWFIPPVVISTIDIGDIRRRIQEGHTLYMLIRTYRLTAEDFRRFYIPTWKRMMVYFISACISALFLKLIGVGLS
jgi:hypothetical protein